MINIFRKIRRKLFSKKASSYLLYAIGEIALVMIGILLALYVNNLNEDRKLKKSINNTLRTISYDLEVDTLTANAIIKYYDANEKNSKKIINREITMDNYKECPECMSLVTIYQPFNIQTKGFEQLKHLMDERTTEKDSLIADITKFYSFFKPLIDKNNDRMETIVMKNFSDFEKKSWFVDLTQRNMTDELIEYFVLSDDYRKKVASHSMLAVGNHSGITKLYKKGAKDFINRINKRLENK